MEQQAIYGYQLKYKLGNGGMSEVWYAENSLGKPAAVKILLSNLSGDSEVKARFENEARMMVQLNHKNIRAIYDYGTIDNRPCMVMEYLEGKDIAQRIKDGEIFTKEQIIAWWNEVVDALQYTHRKNIIHRDIKPSNLFVTEAGIIKLLDYGIAKEKTNTSLTQTGARMGTLMYMSPEQVYDTKDLTYKTDHYSLAVSFYHIVTGQPPYNREDSDFEIQEKIVRQQLLTESLQPPWNLVLPTFLYKNPELRKELHKIEGTIEMTDQTRLYEPLPIPKIQEKPPVITKPITKRKSSAPYLLMSLLVISGLVVLAINREKVLPYIDKFFETKTEVQKKPNIPVAEQQIPQAVEPKIEPEVVIPVPDTTVSEGENGRNDVVITKPDNVVTEGKIKGIINSYYQNRKECGSLYKFFGYTVKQYYNKSNESLDNIMKECEAYHQKWKFTDAEINEDTFVFNHNNEGETFVDFNMLYRIKKEEADEWIPYSIDVSAVFDQEFKITRIVERRIEKLL